MLPRAETDRAHAFVAVAFVDDLALDWLAALLPAAVVTSHDLHARMSEGGEVFAYPFGAVVFHDVPQAARDELLSRLRGEHPRLVPEVVREDFTVVESRGAKVGLSRGQLVVDELAATRASVVALILAQSVTMETYERIVQDLFGRTRQLLERLERRGLIPIRTRRLHRFIGEAVGRRSEVLSTLHLLDKPDALWEDRDGDRIYGRLRAEFDLANIAVYGKRATGEKYLINPNKGG